MANTRQYNNVYDAMLAGFMKLCLVLGIAALTLSKFTGFEWCAPPCSSETARRSALLAPSRPTAQQPSDTRAAAVLRYELDPGGFQGGADGLYCGGSPA